MQTSKHMKNFYLISLLFLCSYSLSAQLSDGSIAPDWTVEDINGETHTLYDYLDAGKSVVLDFGATWCVPCWNYHQSGVLEDLYDEFGPGGTDEIMVFMVEADSDTSQDCIYDLPTCIGGSVGDWTIGVNYPILNPPANQADDLASDYSIAFWPTLYGVAPNGEIYQIGQAGFDEWESYLVGSFLLSNSFYDIDEDGCSSDIDVTVIGGYGELEYEWSSGETTEDLFNLSAGEYTLTVTDENNFEVEIGPIDINAGNGNEIVYSEYEDAECNDSFTGSIYIEAEGGSGVYDYDWSNGDSGAEIFDLPSGDYFVTVTDQSTGCTSEGYYFIDQPDPLDLNFDILDAGCNEEGEVFIDVTGGTGSYSYNFDDFSTSFNQIDLPAGIYDVTVSDFNDCEIAGTFEIEGAPPPDAVSSSSGDINCINNSSTLSSTGSSTGSNISYTWFDSSNNIIGTDPSIVVSNGGDYTLEVFDTDNGCAGFSNVTVAMNNTVPTAVSSYTNAIDCTNPTSTVSGMGSTTTDVIYSWSTTDGMINSGADQLTATVAAGGTYTLLVSDPLNGCTASSSVTVPANANIPSATISPETSFCSGSSLQVCVTTEVGNMITWSIDGIELATQETCIIVNSSSTVTATINNPLSGCSTAISTTTNEVAAPNPVINGSTNFCAGSSTMICSTVAPEETVQWVNEVGEEFGNNPCITVTQAGVYQAIIENANGCVVLTETVITAFDLPSASITGDYSLCEGSTGTICADASGQNYEWILGGAVISIDQCIEVSTGGSYQLNTSNSNCTSTSSAVVEVEAIPTLDVESSGILDCNTQNVILSATTNGTSVTWSDAAGNELATGASYTTNLAGEYFVSTTSPFGCQSLVSFVVEQDNAALPTAGYVFVAQDFTINFTSQIQGTATGYLWDFGDGLTSTEENPTHTFTDGGNYNVCLTVTNDCGSNSTCQSISLSDAIALNAEINHVSCHGGNDGSLEIEINGGVGPFSITTIPDVGTSTSLLGLEAGSYTVTVIDSNGEEINSIFEIEEPTQIELDESIANATAGNSDGSISIVSIEGGTPGYSYLWSNGSTDSTIDNLVAGIYTVEITDANGCIVVEEYEVQEVTSINQIDIIKRFTASPNPAMDNINIQLEMNQQAQVSLELMNSLGKVVYQININAALTSHSIDLTSLTNGIYFIQLKHQNQSMTKKIMVLD